MRLSYLKAWRVWDEIAVLNRQLLLAVVVHLVGDQVPLLLLHSVVAARHPLATKKNKIKRSVSRKEGIDPLPRPPHMIIIVSLSHM
jgi:hypothetical protein